MLDPVQTVLFAAVIGVMAGNVPTVIVAVVSEQPVGKVNINLALPVVTPVTSPAFVTVATAGFVLVHVPPVVGVNCVVVPIQIALEPAMETTGEGFIFNCIDLDAARQFGSLIRAGVLTNKR
jgi:hypothetical protein